VTGDALYTDDLAGRFPNLLHAWPVLAPHAHAMLTSLDPSPALGDPGVVTVLTDSDVPGEGNTGANRHDEPLFPTEVMYHHQPVAWVLGDSVEAARRGASRVAAEYEPLPAVVEAEIRITSEVRGGLIPGKWEIAIEAYDSHRIVDTRGLAEERRAVAEQQERTVTAAGRSMPLPRPFFVLATQNPIEMEGTYQLPEAQIDRFLFKSVLAFPSEDELDSILDLTTGAAQAVPAQVLTVDDILAGQRLVRSVPIASHVRRAVARFVRRTQLEDPDVAADVKRYIRFGISPRGAQSLVLAAKGHALLRHRYNVSFDDLRAVLRPTLRHRFQLNFEGEADQVDAEALLTRLFEDAIRDSV
jgi:hypothetical protein